MGKTGGEECNVIILKTVLGMEKEAASYVEELDPGAEVIPNPGGFRGLVLVRPSIDKHELARLIEQEVPEVENVVVAEVCSPARPEDIAAKAAAIAKEKIGSGESFAVRTVRRGRHSFTSIDVNVVVGDAVRKATGASVNLSKPDKVVLVEIIHGDAFVSIVPGSVFWKKMRPGKYPLYKVFKRISVVQMPYLGPLDACRVMGVRVGREVQNFEVGELVVAPIGLVDARQLTEFMIGLFEGIESRYEIQKKSYGRRVRRVPVKLQDLYQLVRSRKDEVIIVFEPEGEPISKVADKLYELIRKGKRVNMLFGSREGIPEGIYRFADLVVDVAPGITLSTEYAAAAALIAVATVLHDRLVEEENDNRNREQAGGTASEAEGQSGSKDT